MFLDQEYLYDLVTGKIKGPQGAFLRGLLLVLSMFYGAGVVILASFYRLRPLRLCAKVISVGNITLGGTGKTTLVEYLAAKLSSVNVKVAVLSRGYKCSCGGIGDEPAMLKAKLTQVAVIVNPDRIKAAKTAIQDHGCNVLILDDGFQQWRIAKDLEIVTIDAADPFGNYRLLPAGFLREPLFALKRADIFMLTQTTLCPDTENLTSKLQRINPTALIVESRHEPKGLFRLDRPLEPLALDWLKGKRVALCCGIGNPQGFGDSVAACAAKVIKFFKFDDHHDYTQAELRQMLADLQANDLAALITTSKDAVKIRELGINDPAILVLDITLNITKNEAEFNRRLLKLYSI
jgi:tetraacyldisaccharide 4'-kinase